MKDNFGRKIDYLRISITDRCNLRCRYCMPEMGSDIFSGEDILTYEEMTDICRQAAALGIRKIRITGGEPLVREDVSRLVGMLKAIPLIENVSLTTNGIFLADRLDALVANGLDGVNISLDTADRNRYREITGADLFDKVTEAVSAAVHAGIRVKINTVLLGESDYRGMFDFAEKYPIDVRFIELMPMGAAKNMRGISTAEVLSYIDSTYPGRVWDSSLHGSGPAKYIRLPGFNGCIGFIGPISDIFCDECNKIRLTADGHIKPCLYFGDSYDIKTPLRQGNMELVREVLVKSIKAKPQAHDFCAGSAACDDSAPGVTACDDSAPGVTGHDDSAMGTENRCKGRMEERGMSSIGG